MAFSYLLSWIQSVKPGIIDTASSYIPHNPPDATVVITNENDENSDDDGEQLFWEPSDDVSILQSEPDTYYLPGSWDIPKHRPGLLFPVQVPPPPPLRSRRTSAPGRPISMIITAPPPAMRTSNSESAANPASRSDNRLSILLGHQSQIPERIMEIFEGNEVSVSHLFQLDSHSENGYAASHLIVLNFFRAAIIREQEGKQGLTLVADMLQERVVKDALANKLTAYTGKIDNNTINQIQYFDRFMELRTIYEEERNTKGLDAILSHLSSSPSNEWSTFIALIADSTTIGCVRVPTPQGDVFAIVHFAFNEHEVEGHRFIFNNTLSATAQRIREILSIDMIESSQSSKLVGHVFVARESTVTTGDVLFDISLLYQELKRSVVDAVTRAVNLESTKETLESQMEQLRKNHESNTASHVNKFEALFAENRRLAAEVESAYRTRKAMLDPLNQRVDFLETENQRLRAEIDTLRNAVNNRSGDAVVSGATPPNADGPTQKPAGRVKATMSKSPDNSHVEIQRLQSEIKGHLANINALATENSRLVAKGKMRSNRVNYLSAENQRLQLEVKNVAKAMHIDRRRAEDLRRVSMQLIPAEATASIAETHESEAWVDAAAMQSTATLHQVSMAPSTNTMILPTPSRDYVAPNHSMRDYGAPTEVAHQVSEQVSQQPKPQRIPAFKINAFGETKPRRFDLRIRGPR